MKQNDELQHLPCGKTYSSQYGVIEFHLEIKNSLDCVMLIEVDDGQNIFLRIDYLNWDTKENYMDIGLFDEPTQYQIYHISG